MMDSKNLKNLMEIFVDIKSFVSLRKWSWCMSWFSSTVVLTQLWVVLNKSAKQMQPTLL